MTKLVALICVISWAGFWAFGYLALSADLSNSRQVTIAAVLAAMGFISGTFAYIALGRRLG